MAGSPTMTVGIDKTVTALVRKDILENLREVSRWMVPGSFIPGKLIAGTNIIRHVAYGDLAPAASVIAVEGQPPAAEALTIGWAEYATIQRGRLVELTDVAMGLSPHELMTVAAERIAYDAKMTVDRSIADAVAAGAGLTLTVAGAGLAASDIRRWVAQMKKADIPTFGDGFYIAMINPAVTYDLQNDTAIGGWIEASKYADPSRLLNGEIGRMHGVRFIETSIGTVNAGATDTYNTYLIAPDYFAFGDLQSVQTYMVRPGGDHSDPLAQRGLVGYKGMWGAKTLEVAAAGGPRFGTCAAHAGTLDLTA
jgi:N4-gp56 family major capsid protein